MTDQTGALARFFDAIDALPTCRGDAIGDASEPPYQPRTARCGECGRGYMELVAADDERAPRDCAWCGGACAWEG